VVEGYVALSHVRSIVAAGAGALEAAGLAEALEDGVLEAGSFEAGAETCVPGAADALPGGPFGELPAGPIAAPEPLHAATQHPNSKKRPAIENRFIASYSNIRSSKTQQAS
jgi:hypothetical protein